MMIESTRRIIATDPQDETTLTIVELDSVTREGDGAGRVVSATAEQAVWLSLTQLRELSDEIARLAAEIEAKS